MSEIHIHEEGNKTVCGLLTREVDHLNSHQFGATCAKCLKHATELSNYKLKTYTLTWNKKKAAVQEEDHDL